MVLGLDRVCLADEFQIVNVVTCIFILMADNPRFNRLSNVFKTNKMFLPKNSWEKTIACHGNATWSSGSDLVRIACTSSCNDSVCIAYA